MEKKFAATPLTLFEKSESGIGFQPVFGGLTGWKPTPLVVLVFFLPAVWAIAPVFMRTQPGLSPKRLVKFQKLDC